MNSSAKTPPKLLCSVVVATYRGADKLEKLLASLSRQTLTSNTFEVIFVDDRSPAKDAEETRLLCEKYSGRLQIRLVALLKNGGPARARNKGVEAAQGEYIFFTDDDCEVPALWLETHLNIYKQRPELSAIGGWYFFSRKELETNIYAQFWYIHYKSIFYPLDLETFTGVSDEAPILPAQNTANLSVRRGVFNALGGFDEDFIAPGREDTYFAENLFKAGFLSLFIPLHVRHTSPLTLKRFWRVIINRGSANYVYLCKKNWRNYYPLQNKYFHKTFRHHLARLCTRNISVRKNKTKLLLLSKIYYFGTYSNTALFFHAWRWKRIIRKRYEI